MQKHRAEEGCKERLEMLSFPPGTKLDSFAPREAVGMWLCCLWLNSQQTSGSSGLNPAPAQGQDGAFQSFSSQTSPPGPDKIKEPQRTPWRESERWEMRI